MNFLACIAPANYLMEMNIIVSPFCNKHFPNEWKKGVNHFVLGSTPTKQQWKHISVISFALWLWQHYLSWLHVTRQFPCENLQWRRRAIIVKSQQWPPLSESITICCVRKLISCVTHLQSCAKVDTWNKNKNNVLLLRSKLKIAKIEHNCNPSTKHGYTPVQQTRS